MVRFVLDPAGRVTPDFAAKLPGRGAWVTASRDAVTNAAAKNLFARAFKAQATSPEDLADLVAAGLEKRALDALGLARRSGMAVAGFDQVKAALKDGSAGVLITSRDAAADGAEKLARLARSAAVFRMFASDALSAALGKDGVRHVAVTRGAAADRFVREARRLAGFTVGGGEAGADGKE